ncbi:MAG: helix-turn-helix transcriptional regulator [Ruminococcaceae bacterium]|nr:helix-turn-helix transcriptional regulator [Oscillospiraceae bacterium]
MKTHTSKRSQDFDAYKRLKDIREDHDLSQKDIAELLNTNQQQISRWETGTQMMGVDKYVILARYYNVSVDYLLGLTDIPKKLYE